MAKTKTKSMTITEISRVTGVSGASITALVEKWQLKPTKTGQYNRKYYSPKDCQRIIDYYSSKAKTGTKTTKTATKDDLIEALRAQLKAKDKQIDQLNEQLKMAQINLNQSQQLQLEQANQIKRLEAPQQATGAAESHSEQDDKEKSRDEPKDVKKAPSKPENNEGKTTVREKILKFFQKS